jgi:hypothetical protein
LAFCPNCGSEVTPQNKFCPSCGFQLAKSVSPSAAKSGTERKIEVQRPAAEKLLSWIQVGLGIVLVVLGVLVMLTLSNSNFVLGFGIALVFVGLVSFAAGYGLWKVQTWANSALTLSGIFYFVLGAILVLPLSGWIATEGALSIVLGAFTISWTRSARFRTRFGGRA